MEGIGERHGPEPSGEGVGQDQEAGCEQAPRHGPWGEQRRQPPPQGQELDGGPEQAAQGQEHSQGPLGAWAEAFPGELHRGHGARAPPAAGQAPGDQAMGGGERQEPGQPGPARQGEQDGQTGEGARGEAGHEQGQAAEQPGEAPAGGEEIASAAHPSRGEQDRAPQQERVGEGDQKVRGRSILHGRSWAGPMVSPGGRGPKGAPCLRSDRPP